jgi:hypothetical protein
MRLQPLESGFPVAQPGVMEGEREGKRLPLAGVILQRFES